MATIAAPRKVTANISRKMNGAIAPSAKPKASPELTAQKFDLAIALILASWPALTVAVQNQWGGPDSTDKRDWLAGAVSDLFATNQETDEEDVEDMLLQVMGDEFDLQVEDGSEIQVASDILKARQRTMEGDFEVVDRLYEKWAERQKKGEKKTVVNVQEREEEVDEDGWGSSGDDDDDHEGQVPMDVEMDDAPPQLVEARPKPEPEVDEEGFTKVVSKKKR